MPFHRFESTGHAVALDLLMGYSVVFLPLISTYSTVVKEEWEKTSWIVTELAVRLNHCPQGRVGY